MKFQEAVCAKNKNGILANHQRDIQETFGGIYEEENNAWIDGSPKSVKFSRRERAVFERETHCI